MSDIRAVGVVLFSTGSMYCTCCLQSYVACGVLNTFATFHLEPTMADHETNTRKNTTGRIGTTGTMQAEDL